MTIEIVRGCIFEAFERGDINYLVHQVNCIGAFGGLAGEVGRRYPDVYRRYQEAIKGGTPLLGAIQPIWIEGDKFIVNLFGQHQIGTHKRQTNYGAVANGLLCLRDELVDDVVGLPYKFGCGLGGADWNIVLEMIEFIFRDHNVKIYQL